MASHAEQLVPRKHHRNLELNTFWDGVFHSSTFIFVVAGLYILWRLARRRHLYWSNKLLIGTMLIGFGAFNVVEGLVDHQFLGVHHVNETVHLLGYGFSDVGRGDVHHRLDAHALR